MRFFVPWLACVFAGSLSFESLGADISPKGRFDAVGLVVSDIDASERFYTDILGFEKSGGFALDEAWSEQAQMANGKAFKVRLYRMGDGEGAVWLKLAHFEEPPKRQPRSGINIQAGVNYLTLWYTDYGDVRRRLEAAGVEIVGELAREGYELIVVRDPDGVFIEIGQSVD